MKNIQLLELGWKSIEMFVMTRNKRIHEDKMSM